MSLLNFCFSHFRKKKSFCRINTVTGMRSIINKNTPNRTLEIIMPWIIYVWLKINSQNKNLYTNRERERETTTAPAKLLVEKFLFCKKCSIWCEFLLIHHLQMWYVPFIAPTSLSFRFDLDFCLKHPQPHSCQYLSFFFSLFLYFRQNIDSSNLQCGIRVCAFFPLS